MLLALICGYANADLDDDLRRTVREVVPLLVAADSQALSQLSTSGSDPWLIVDELRRQGLVAPARTYVLKVLRLPPAAPLARYAQTVPTPSEKERYGLLRRAYDLRIKGASECALTLLRTLDRTGDITSIRLLLERARAWRDQGDLAHADGDLLAASRRALALGWTRASQHALRTLADRYCFSSADEQRRTPGQAAESFALSLRRHLRPGEVLVRLRVVRGELLAFLIDGEKRWSALLGPYEKIASRWRELGRKDGKNGDVPSLLDRPLGLERRHEKVILVVDGTLAWIPMAALTRREVSFLSSFWRFLSLRRRPRLPRRYSGRGVLAVACPRPGTIKEAEEVGSVVLTGRDANRREIRYRCGQRRWRAIHFACQVVSGSESTLAVPGILVGDGVLSLTEFKRFYPRTDLIVFSHSQTGVTEDKGRFVVSPLRLLSSERPRVLVHLWAKDNEASLVLLARFYEMWDRDDWDGGAAAALRAAQQEVRADRKWRRAYYWAGWQLWGDPD